MKDQDKKEECCCGQFDRCDPPNEYICPIHGHQAPIPVEGWEEEFDNLWRNSFRWEKDWSLINATIRSFIRQTILSERQALDKRLADMYKQGRFDATMEMEATLERRHY